MTDISPASDQARWARKWFRWRLVLAWIAVAIISTHYLLHPVANVVLVYAGEPALPPLEPLSWEALMAIIGGPVAGAYADRMAGEV